MDRFGSQDVGGVASCEDKSQYSILLPYAAIVCIFPHSVHKYILTHAVYFPGELQRVS